MRLIYRERDMGQDKAKLLSELTHYGRDSAEVTQEKYKEALEFWEFLKTLEITHTFSGHNHFDILSTEVQQVKVKRTHNGSVVYRHPDHWEDYGFKPQDQIKLRQNQYYAFLEPVQKLKLITGYCQSLNNMEGVSVGWQNTFYFDHPAKNYGQFNTTIVTHDYLVKPLAEYRTPLYKQRAGEFIEVATTIDEDHGRTPIITINDFNDEDLNWLMKKV